jgi:hypothetical protein
MKAPHRRARRARSSEGSEVAVYDGRRFLGSVACGDGHHTAHDANGVALGNFPSSRDAADAILKAARVSA